MEQRVSLITLGVVDLARARAFYEALGWQSASKPEDGVVFFQGPGTIVGLWSREELAEDGGLADSGGWGGVTLAYNARSRDEVNAVFTEAEAAGGRVTKPPRETFWGGYSGTFLDPDGHAWEVAHNPFWTIGPDGAVTL